TADRGRDRPGADGRDELLLHLGGRGGRRTPHAAVLRDHRQPRDVQGRLVGLRPSGQGAVGHLARDSLEVGARVELEPGRRSVGALLPAGRLLAGERPGGAAPGEAGGAEGALLGGGGAEPRAAPARLRLRDVRNPPTATDRDPPEVRGRRPERAARARTEDLRTL